ncbi:MAG: diguanylate cyclase [Planctomycetota bacterium]
MPTQFKTPSARVLIVDDNTDIHEDFRKILCSRSSQTNQEFEEMEILFGMSDDKSDVDTDVEIVCASQGKEGYAMVKKSIEDGVPFSLAFMDIRMPPGWDGIQTTKKIWELDPEIQVVICSAYSDYSWHEMARELGHSNRFLVLKKPFESVEVRQLVAALHHRWFSARSDSLTGLMNRTAFMEHFDRHFDTLQNEVSPLSCCLIDLDFFKHINDVHGHDLGDEALRKTAQLLQSRCLPGDYVSRYGGEEFCVLLKDRDQSTARQWAEQTRLALQKIDLQGSDGSRIQLTASLGIVTAGNEQNSKGLIKNADFAMLYAKQRGRNRVVDYADIEAEIKLDKTADRKFMGVTARAIMNPVKTVEKTAGLKQAAQVLLNDKVPSAPVVDSRGQLVGLLNESDLLQQLLDGDQMNATSNQIMQTSVVYFQEDTPLREIYEFLIRVAIPQVVIVRDNRPVGMIARANLLGWLCSQISLPIAVDGPTLPSPQTSN